MAATRARAVQPRIAGWVLFAISLALLVSTGAFVLLTPSSSAPTNFKPTPVDFLFPPMVLAFSVVGALILWSRPGNRIGWMCAAIGVLFSIQAWVIKYAAFALFAHHGDLPGGVAAMWAAQWTFAPPFILCAGFLPLLFPDGHLPSRRWLPVFVLAVATGALIIAQRMLFPEMDLQGYRMPNPTGVQAQVAPLRAVNSVIGGLMIVTFLSAVLSLFNRFRRADYEQRQQLKWFLSAIALLVVALATSFLSGAFLSFGSGVDVLVAVGLLLVPLGIGVAILHNHLFDIDFVISRTVLYGALAAFITAVYLLLVLGVGTLLGTGTRGNIVLSIVATAIVALLFQPVRQRTQAFASRLVYGARATPYEVLSEFSQRVSESYATDDVLERMARILANGTSATRACVWLHVGDQMRLAAAHPSASGLDGDIPLRDGEVPAISGADRVVAVRHQGELLGLLSVTKRAGERLTPIEEKLLVDLGSQAGLVLRNVRLTAELMERMAELQASRQRLVKAQDQERRRLERDLHDGAQQHLVALKVKLGLAEMLSEQDPAKARLIVGELKTEADEALETLRDLARGIFPPVLVDRGLVAALEAQSRIATMQVRIEADGLGRYPQETEAAVYFCCLEALQNAAKHAQASEVVVRLHERDGELRFDVRDDGRGFDAEVARLGSGLQNMRDRLESLGGSLEIRSRPGSGTTVSGSAPVPVLEAAPA